MPEHIIRSEHTIKVVTEIPYPEAFPQMSLDEAKAFQRDLDLVAVALDCMTIGQTEMATVVTVKSAPQEEEATRTASCPPCPAYQCKGDDHD